MRERTTEEPWASAALVLCAHGVRGGAGAAEEHAALIRRRRIFAEVRACALRGRPGLAETLAALRAGAPPVPSPIYLAPLLMAEGYTLRAMLRRLGDGAPAPGPAAGRGLLLCPPVGTHPRLAVAMAAKALVACRARSWPPEETALLIVGHGTRRDPNSGATARRHARWIGAGGAFAEVAVAFLDEPPAVPEALAGLTAPRCVAVGLFVDRGEHGEEDIPRLLASAAGDGWRGAAAYAGPIGPDPLVADLILDRVRAAEPYPLAA
jgi:sirohydrochlorin cobaltochelatase